MLLTVLIVVPAVTALLVALAPRGAARLIALLGSAATFVVSLALLGQFVVGDAGFQLTQTAEWIPSWGISYRVGIDGVSLFLVLLTTLMVPITVLAAWEQTQGVKGFFGSLLALEAALVGVFVALDLILFYVFFEAMLIPMYALIGIWGGGNRRYAAVKFLLYTLAGSLFMLVAVLYLYFSAGAESFAYESLLALDLTRTEQLWLFGAFFIAFAIKVPLFPLHTWLPDAHTDAPTAGSVLLAAIMLKIGGYGFLRFSLPYFPEATLEVAPLIIGLGVIGVLYGAAASSAWWRTRRWRTWASW